MPNSDDVDQRLLWLLRVAGDEWGPLGVAKVAMSLTDATLIACQEIESGRWDQQVHRVYQAVYRRQKTPEYRNAILSAVPGFAAKDQPQQHAGDDNRGDQGSLTD